MHLKPPVTSAGKADGRASMEHEDEVTMGGHPGVPCPKVQGAPSLEQHFIRLLPTGGSRSGWEPGECAGSPHRSSLSPFLIVTVLCHHSSAPVAVPLSLPGDFCP